MYDVIIIGAGPAGYTAGIRAGQLGMKTALIDKKGIGGMCLNWGCIPAKTMLESALFFDRMKQAEAFGIGGVNSSELKFSWKDAAVRGEKVKKAVIGGVKKRLEQNGVDIIEGNAEIISSGYVSVHNRTLETNFILIASGSRFSPLPWKLSKEMNIPAGSLFSRSAIPEEVTVYGSGSVAVEIAEICALTGKKVELLAETGGLMPGFGKALTNFVEHTLEKHHVRIVRAEDTASAPETPVINCSSRKAVLPPMKTECALDDGFIEVDRFFRTSLEKVYAAGDVTGLSFYAHAASAQALSAVNHMKGIKREHDKFLYPLTAYTVPEVAQIGMTEEDLESEGVPYRMSQYGFEANGKALAEGDSEGFVRVLYGPKYGEIFGVQIAGRHASDMISEASVLIQAEGTVFDIAGSVHAHPTVSEVFMEAGLKAVSES